MRHHLIRKLLQKKHREETGLLLVEGETSVLEALTAGPSCPFRPDYLAATEAFLAAHAAPAAGIPTDVATADELARAGSLASNDAAILVLRRTAELPTVAALLSQAKQQQRFLLALDAVGDPGNLGTLLRIADWYGLAGLLATPGTVDPTNPKTISASKGSFLRVPVAFGDLAALLEAAARLDLPTYAASLDGQPLHDLAAARPGVLLMGSETHGIDPAIRQRVQVALTIPRYGGAESLNVAVAAGIVLDRLRFLAG